MPGKLEGSPICPRCNGCGTYYWGGSVNGVPRFSGVCFRCNGDGRWHPSTASEHMAREATR